MIDKAFEICVDNGYACPALICRKMKIKFTEAISLIDEMEGLKLISTFELGTKRKILKQIETK